MADTPINDDVRDIMQRILETTQNLQRRLFRAQTRAAMNERTTGVMHFDALSIMRDVDDLVALTGRPQEPPAD